MWKERLISNILIIILVILLELAFFNSAGILSSVIAFLLLALCIIAMGSIFMEIYPPKLKADGTGSFFKNFLVYILLGTLTIFINRSFFGVNLLTISFFIAAVVNLFFILKKHK
jgi:hypothetical protein